MRMKKFFSFVFVFFTIGCAFAQDDLLDQLNAEKSDVKDKETTAFKGLQICNIQSTKMTAKGEWYMIISHRFGDLTEGLDNFFGLDNALTKIGGIYGVTDWLSLGASRHTYNKIYAEYFKDNQPCRTTVGIDALPTPIAIELKCIAIVD